MRADGGVLGGVVGEPVSAIAKELVDLAVKLEHGCDLPLGRLCILVSKDERKELVEWWKSTRRFIDHDAPQIDFDGPFFVRRIEVRLR